MFEKKAYAKINLSLEVLGKRTDGYHDIASVMQLVDLHDTLTFEPADALSITGSLPGLGENRENLVARAADSLRQSTGMTRGAHIELTKRIPMAAGLAGGSSDAAATLHGLCKLWGIDLSKDELLALAATLGSDVPFFMDGPTALVEGRGERVTPLPAPPPMLAVLVCPSFQVAGKTRHLYENLTAQDMTDGSVTRSLVAALERRDYPLPDLLHNAFVRASELVFPGLDDIQKQILQAGSESVHLSGSGPTLFTLLPLSEQPRAEAIYGDLKAEGLNAFLTRFVTPE